MATEQSKAKRMWWLRRYARVLRSRPRYSTSAVVFFALAAALTVSGVQPVRSLLLAFDIATALFLALTAIMFTRSGTASIRLRACEQDQGRWGFLWSSVVLSAVVLLALGLELQAAKHGGAIEIVLAASSLLLSWIFTNTIFALHYAHEFYGEHGQQHSGLEFPHTEEPDYWDFVYFSFVIGMTFQVSDVQISARSIRRVALAHGTIAFFFNVVIIALTVNLVAGQA